MTARPSTEHSPRPRISREFIEAHRRRRIVDAVAELLHEFGREGASVTNIVSLAGTARNSFYEVFGSGEECIAYGARVALEELFAALDALEGEGEWAAELHEAIAGFYAAVAADPVLAELLLVHSAASKLEEGRAAGRAGAERFAPLLHRGRLEASSRGRAPLPVTAEEYLSRAIVAVATGRVRGARAESLPADAAGVATLVAGFYLGQGAADLAPPQSQAATARP